MCQIQCSTSASDKCIGLELCLKFDNNRVCIHTNSKLVFTPISFRINQPKPIPAGTAKPPGYNLIRGISLNMSISPYAGPTDRCVLTPVQQKVVALLAAGSTAAQVLDEM